MKKTYFTLLLLTLSVPMSAQIVNIPDANFKARLLAANTTNGIARDQSNVSIKIDVNDDGEIQVSEALLVASLSVNNASISNLSGLSSFSNLRSIICSFNTISTIDLTGMNNLRSIRCDHNQLTSLNLGGLSSLTSVECDYNQLTTLSLNGLSNLSNLDCSYNQLTSIDVSSITSPNLGLRCAGNNITTIDLSVRFNKITGVDCSYNPNLTSINTKDNRTMVNVVVGPGDPPPPPSLLGLIPEIFFLGTPNLQFICADADDFAYIQAKLIVANNTNPNAQLSSTCNFNNPSIITTASACGSYIWSVNNQTYTTSGSYVVTIANQTYVLNLTIYPTASTQTQTVCGSYTWPVNNQTYTQSGTYTTTITNTGGCSETKTLQLTVVTNPTILTQPNNIVLCSAILNSSATITTTTNVPNLTYSWQFRVVTSSNPNPTWTTIVSGAEYSGQGSNALTVIRTATSPAVGTEYRVVISSTQCGTLTSNTATVSLQSNPVAGTVSAPSRVCQGSNATFTLTGQTGTIFQWQSAPTATGVFVNIPGATSSSYTLANAQPTMNRAYRVVVSTAACNNLSATSAARTITIDRINVAGTVTGGGAVCLNGSGTLRLTGSSGLIQWEYSTNGGASYTNAPTAATVSSSIPFSTTSTTSTASSYNVTNITNNVLFRARVSMGTCSVLFSNSVAFTIATTATVGTISAVATTICPSTSTSLTLTNATGVITWQRSGNYTAATPTWINIANSNTSTLSTGNLIYSSAYRALVTIGSCSTVISNVVVVTVIPRPIAKSIVKNTTTPSGNTATTALCTSNFSKTLTIGAGYTGTIQWQSSTTSTTTGFVDIPGATAPTYTITNPVAGPNYFRARFTNSCGVSVNGVATTVFYTTCKTSESQIQSVTARQPFAVIAHPNPSSSNFTIQLETTTDEIIKTTVYDTTGRVVDQYSLNPIESKEFQVGVNYPAGIYNVVVTQGNTTKAVRIIKK